MQSVLKLLKDKNFDAIEKMRMLAEGDAVGLGLMTRKEYKQKTIWDTDGIIDTESGKEVALKLIPVKLRAEMAKELAKYTHAQIKPAGDEDVGDGKITNVHVYVPANGRDIPDPGPKEPPKKKIKIIKKKKKKSKKK